MRAIRRTSTGLLSLLTAGLLLGGACDGTPSGTDSSMTGKSGMRSAALRTTAAFTVAGTVYGGSTPLEGAVVTAVADGTSTAVATDTTDAGGDYGFVIEEGTYDLQVVPPAGGGFGEEVIQNVVVAADVNQDIVLLPESNTRLTGTVTGHDGNAVENVLIRVYQGSSLVTSVRTAADGSYGITISAGTYRLQFTGGSANVPAGYYQCDLSSVAISGETSFDYAIPLLRVQGSTLGSDGSSVGSVGINVYQNNAIETNHRCYASYNTSSNADGAYSLLAFPGALRLISSPPVSSSFGITREDLQLTDDLDHDIVLPQETALSGQLTGYQGGVVANARVYFYHSSGTGTNTTTDSEGRYSVELSPGTYQVRALQGSTRSDNAPGAYDCSWYGVQVAGTTTYDMEMPVIRVTGQVRDSEQASVASASVRIISGYSPPGVSCSSNYQSTADGSGVYSHLTFPSNSARFNVLPPSSTALGPETLARALEGDSTQDFELVAALTLSGTVRGYADNPVPNVQMDFYRDGMSIGGRSDANGNYSVRLSAGTYRVFVSGYGESLPSNYNYCYFYNIEVQEDRTFDATMPVLRVRGRVTDFNGAPVPGVSVRTDAASYSVSNVMSCYHQGTNITSDAGGDYSFLSLRKTTNFVITPPVDSGFAPTTLTSVVLAGDLDQRIILQRPDTTPPTIVSGPTVIHLSDTSVSIDWVTDEPADSQVAYGLTDLGDSAGQLELVTRHSVTLLDLEPAAIYQFQVSSTDAAGNGPTQSSVHTFSTQPPPGDITPPVITGGPGIAFIDQTNAMVQWTTDEPATSVVRYGASADALDQIVSSPAGVFAQSHLVTLAGLTPQTTYFAQVESTDPDGNGPTVSEVFSFTTTDVPDTAAPAIIAGPTIQNVTDTTITVTWLTDEPSTSGVSYTDGTVFDLVSDDNLVSNHSITLANLTPDTAYSITVSSKDAVDNGPTLGGPITGTTLAAPDTDAPLITDIAVEVGETTARITWLTDELATSRIDYVPVSGSPAGTVADVAFVDSHGLTITGLAANTTYSFTLTSVDAAGNSGSSEPQQFTTLRGNTAPVANAGPDQSPGCADAGGTLDVTLDGSGSTDADGDALTFAWSADGVPIASGVSPTIALPPGTHTITLIVDDGQVSSAADTVVITVADCASTCTRTGLWDRCTEECPCPDGEGDCDSDSECQEGMRCLNDAGLDYGYSDPEIDVCVSGCPAAGVGGGNFCTEECPCAHGEGDCDNDSQCEAGMVCMFDVGIEFGYGDREIDVCVSGCPSFGVGGWDFCTEECPCGAGQGDCDSDSECQSGLVCGHDNGDDYGYDGEVDACVAPMSLASAAAEAGVSSLGQRSAFER